MSQLFLLLTLLTLSASIQMTCTEILKTLLEQWMIYKEDCGRNMSSEPIANGLVCNRTFDRYACWPDGQPNTTVSVSCPWYLPWHHKVQHGFVYQKCDSEGHWVSPWNASECEQDDSDQQYGPILSKFLAMYTVGYSLSLGALVLALSILVAFRKLHCMRNNIHMNLFASFILRALSILAMDALLYKATVHIPPDDVGPEHQMERLVNNKMAVACRFAVVMMQYSIMANSYWLLVEGIYLYNLLVVTVFTERNYFNIYLCIGWGTPLIFVLPWVTVKYLYENEECWERIDNMGYWWIIRSPILLAVLINFFIFVQIIKVLMSKLRAHQMRYTDYKFRLAKSTLTLIPLLGIQMILSAFFTDEQVRNGPLRLARLFYDLFFDSFQGLLVAILYCFVNKEVQSEMTKRWKRWKLGKDIEEEYRHTHSQLHQNKGSIAGQPARPPPSPLPEPTCVALGQEESQRLVGRHRNCTGKTQSCLPFPLPPQDGSNQNVLMQNICLGDRAQCYMPHHESAESDF